MTDAVSQVRSFNRLITLRVGALNDQYLARSRPLGEARLLWEIGVEGCDVRKLRSRLGLDSGYLSRLLRSLESVKLVRVEPNRTTGESVRCGSQPPGVSNAICSSDAVMSWPARFSSR